MITIHEITEAKLFRHPGRTVECPHCERTLVFYGISPSKCPHCKISLINLTNIIKSSFYRISYHSGTINNAGYVKFLAG